MLCEVFVFDLFSYKNKRVTFCEKQKQDVDISDEIFDLKKSIVEYENISKR